MQRGRRSFTSRSAGRIDPEEVIEPLRIGHVVNDMPPEIDEFLSSICTPPPEPISVHLVKRSKQHDDPLVLKFLQSRRNQVELPYPGVVAGSPRREHVCQVDRVAILLHPSALSALRVERMEAESHQPAVVPIVDEDGVGAFPSKTYPDGSNSRHPIRRDRTSLTRVF